MKKKIINVLIIIFMMSILFFTHVSYKLESLLIPLVEVGVPESNILKYNFTVKGELQDGYIVGHIKEDDLYKISESTQLFVNDNLIESFEIEDNTIKFSAFNSMKENIFIEVETVVGEYTVTVPNSSITGNTIYALNEKDGVFTLEAKEVDVIATDEKFTAVSKLDNGLFIIKRCSVIPQENMIVNVYQEGDEIW